MTGISIFREYSLFQILLKTKIYLNGESIASLRNGSKKNISLAPGHYEVFAANQQSLIPIRKKELLHSNILQIDIIEGQEYVLHLCPHPLCWYGKYHPTILKMFSPIECLLLLKDDEYFENNRIKLKEFDSQIKKEIELFHYHPITLIFISTLSLFSIVCNTWQPDWFATKDGIAWVFLFGFGNIIGLLTGSNKQMLANGWEYKMLIYTALGCSLILIDIASTQFWLRVVYSFSVIFTCIWAGFCFKRWKKKKKGLDIIEHKVIELESTF